MPNSPRFLKVAELAELLKVNRARFTRWLRRIAFLIESRPAQTFFVSISMKSWSGRAEKTLSLLSENVR